MQNLPTAHVPLPEISFDAQGQPFSTQFNDVYFSRGGGVAETRHVFLAGNDLPARFAANPRFTIGELGFGTGLNFLVAWHEFLRTTDVSHHLHYIAVEKYPLTAEMLAKIHASWIGTSADSTHYNSLLKSLLTFYPLRLPGWHRIPLERCTLTIGFGDAAELLASIDANVDTWFIDGFSPAKNPEMWQEYAIKQLARLSAPTATFATFTAAGAVKRSLQAHGFHVEKVQGFGTKRDMLVGCRLPAASAASPSPKKMPHTQCVIGAGIAGATLARALAERGFAVTVLERETIASGASGNPAGVLYPQLTKFYTPATAWHFTAYSFMLRQIARWKAQGMQFATGQPGMLRLPRPEQNAENFTGLQMDASIMRYVSRAEASALAGTDVASDGWWFAHGTWLSPTECCRDLLQHPNITVREHTAVKSLAPGPNGWKITWENDDFIEANQVCIAAAQYAADLLPDIHLPMGISAGQVSLLPADCIARKLNCIVSHRGYIIPLPPHYLLGATYDRSDSSGAITEKNHAENLQHARDALPGWLPNTPPMQGRTAFRATTPDRLPYVGEVADGLYVSVGHGSRGLISAPLAAEIISAQIANEIIPLSRELLAAIDPRRRSRP